MVEDKATRAMIERQGFTLERQRNRGRVRVRITGGLSLWGVAVDKIRIQDWLAMHSKFTSFLLMVAFIVLKAGQTAFAMAVFLLVYLICAVLVLWLLVGVLAWLLSTIGVL